MLESWGGREKPREPQGSGVLEAVTGENSYQVSKGGET